MSDNRASSRAAIELLQERLLDSRSPSALAVPLRQGLQKLHDSARVTLRDATEKNNASFLIIGDHGTGKTLVSVFVKDTHTDIHTWRCASS